MSYETNAKGETQAKKDVPMPISDPHEVSRFFAVSAIMYAATERYDEFHAWWDETIGYEETGLRFPPKDVLIAMGQMLTIGELLDSVGIAFIGSLQI